MPNFERQSSPSPRSGRSWKEMIAGAALVAGGITGDAHSRATAKSDHPETVTQPQARNERALPGVRSARQERVRAEPTLDELQRIRILNRE
jgi:uncharacterized membrane protein